MNEIWLPVVGYEGLYEVSNLGRVRSLNYKRTGERRVLIQRENNVGYLLVNLWQNGKGKTVLVHRIVAEAFIPNWFSDPCINHRDENPKNNFVDNLEWCDHKYNTNYGTCIKRRSEKLSKPILQLTKTGEIVREWNSIMEASRNGFDQSDIWLCCNGKYKQHKGYIWRYKETA